MQIKLTTSSLKGKSPGTIGKVYHYVLAVIPPALLEQANLRPMDKLSKRVEGRKVFLSYDPENGHQYTEGQIGINEEKLPYPVKLTRIKGQPLIRMVDYQVVGEELMFEIPEDMFVIRRGFGLLSNLINSFRKEVA